MYLCNFYLSHVNVGTQRTSSFPNETGQRGKNVWLFRRRVNLTQRETAGIKKENSRKVTCIFVKEKEKRYRHTQKTEESSCCNIGHKNLRLKKTPGCQSIMSC